VFGVNEVLWRVARVRGWEAASQIAPRGEVALFSSQARKK